MPRSTAIEPASIARLPHARGFAVPWFVEWIDGVPDFRVMDGRKLQRAVADRRCWVCGGRMGRHAAYVIGPMCAVNRTSAEPPSHCDCATYSARACPFLSRPHARRRDLSPELAAQAAEPSGIMLERNPGVTLVWHIEGKVRTKPDYRGGLLFDIGDPVETLWFCEGREATREEVMASISSGLPALEELASEQGERALRALRKQVDEAVELVPA
jgi:hypothetical protein